VRRGAQNRIVEFLRIDAISFGVKIERRGAAALDYARNA